MTTNAATNYRAKTAGIVLVGIGVVTVALRFWGESSEGLTLMLMGVIFGIAYGYRKNIGFLVPAGILLGLGGGSYAAHRLGVGDGVEIGLGIGFVVIWAVRALVERENTWWPLIPGAVLLSQASVDESFDKYFDFGWPLLLIALGCWLLLQGRLSSRIGNNPKE